MHTVITIVIRDAEWRLQQQLAAEIEQYAYKVARETLAHVRWTRTAVGDTETTNGDEVRTR